MPTLLRKYVGNGAADEENGGREWGGSDGDGDDGSGGSGDVQLVVGRGNTERVKGTAVASPPRQSNNWGPLWRGAKWRWPLCADADTNVDDGDAVVNEGDYDEGGDATVATYVDDDRDERDDDDDYDDDVWGGAGRIVLPFSGKGILKSVARGDAPVAPKATTKAKAGTNSVDTVALAPVRRDLRQQQQQQQQQQPTGNVFVIVADGRGTSDLAPRADDARAVPERRPLELAQPAPLPVSPAPPSVAVPVGAPLALAAGSWVPSTLRGMAGDASVPICEDADRCQGGGGHCFWAWVVLMIVVGLIIFLGWKLWYAYRLKGAVAGPRRAWDAYRNAYATRGRGGAIGYGTPERRGLFGSAGKGLRCAEKAR
jgi:hypothetical protein